MWQHLFAAINIVAEKEVVWGRREPAVLKQPQQVAVLSVDVTCNEKEVNYRREKWGGANEHEIEAEERSSSKKKSAEVEKDILFCR